MTDDLTLKMFQFLSGDLSLKDFETVVYREQETIEAHFGQDQWLLLLEFDYRRKDAEHEIAKILTGVIQAEEYERWRLMTFLESIIARDSKAAESILQVYDLYWKGCDFLEHLGRTYGSPLETPLKYEKYSWSDLSDVEQSELLESVYPGVKDEAEKVLGLLKERKFILIKHSDDDYSYIDLRDATEKSQAAALKAAAHAVISRRTRFRSDYCL